MWKKALLLVFAGLSAGCMSSIGSTPTESVYQETPHIATPVEVTSMYTLESTRAPITQINIPQRHVQVFDKQPDFSLLVKTEEYKTGTIDLSRMVIENAEILSDTIIHNPVVNGSGDLVAQINRQNEKRVLQIRNISSNEENLVDLPTEAVLAKWLDDTKLAIWGSLSEGGCLHLLSIYDNSTQAIAYPKNPMPNLQKSECAQLPLVTSDGTKIIFPWRMFDFDSGISAEIFPFMRNIPQILPAYSLKEIDGNISLAYASEDILNFVLNVPIAEINNIDINPETIPLPGLGTKGGWWQPLMWRPTPVQIGIDLIDKGVDPLELLVSGQQVPTRFYLIDLSARKIIDYEMDRAVFAEGSLPQTIYDGFPSPDGEYFAWTIYDSSSRVPIGSKVLEFSSGDVLSIPDVELLGWIVSMTE